MTPPSTARPPAMPMLRRWYYVVPVVYLAVILAVQPADRIVTIADENPSPEYPLRGPAVRWLTDDADTIAYAIRAENAARGRKAGLERPGLFGRTTGWRYPTWRTEEFDEKVAPFEPVTADTQPDFEALLARPYKDDQHLGLQAVGGCAVTPPLATFRDRYFLEYPPLALYLFRLGLIGAPGDGPPDVHPTLLDDHQFYIGCHVPNTPAEVVQCRRFRHAARVYAVLMTAVLLGLMLLLDRGFPGSPTWLLVLPGFLYFTPCRFDILPGLLVMASILAADKRRVAAAGLLLGLAVAFKMYPLVLAPILLRFSARSWKDAFLWCGCAAVPVLVGYAVMFATDGREGVVIPFQFQLARDYEPGWCFYGKFLPPELAFKTLPWSAIRTAIPLLTAVGWSLFRPPDVASLLRRCVFALLAFLTVSVFYSPQWWQWVTVLLVPLCVRHRWLIWPAIFLDLWTYLHFPVLFDFTVTWALGAVRAGDQLQDDWNPVGNALRIVHVWVRAVGWLALSCALAWHEMKRVTTNHTKTTNQNSEQ